MLRFGSPVWDDPAVLAQAQAQLAADPAFGAITGPLGTGAGSLSATQFANLHVALGDAGSLPAVPPASSPVSPALYQAYRQTAQFVSPDGRTVQYYAVLRAGPVASVAATAAVPQAQAALDAVARAVGAEASGVAGIDASFQDIATVATSSTATVVPVVLVLILVLLAVLLRSLVAPGTWR